MTKLFLPVVAVFFLAEVHLWGEPASVYAETFKYLGEENTGMPTNGRLVQAGDGNFYGTTQSQGNQLGGVIFRLTPQGVLRAIFSFGIQPSDLGGYPLAGLAVGADGYLYGTTTQGGDHIGSFFKSNLAGLVTPIRNNPFGGFSYAYTRLTRASDGSFYAGVYDTETNPPYPQSGVIHLKSDGTIIFGTAMDRSTNGAEPLAPLVDGGDGYFYGTASVGGANDLGTVFRVSSTGVITALHSFNGDDGSTPKAPLVKAPDGNFYGTTTNGGDGDQGTVFRLTPDGTLTTLESLGGNDGSYPSGGLTLGPDGNLYGTTNLGGANNGGTFYLLTLAGGYVPMADFGDSTGTVPVGGVTLGQDGHFYGTTRFGGDNGVGTAYRVTTNGDITKLASFGDAAVKTAGNLIKGLDGNFYGPGSAGPFYVGKIFKLLATHEISIIASVDDTMGTGLTPIVQDADGNFFGATRYGGASDKGRVYEVSADGEVTVLASLSSATGFGATDFIQGDDGNYYGAGVGDGITASAVFRVTPSGAVTKFVSLGFKTIEQISLMQANDGTFYGTSSMTVDVPEGLVFKLTSGGTASILHPFNLAQSNDGTAPAGGVTEGLDGNLYGTTSEFGETSSGTYFRLTPDGTFTTLAPLGSLGALLRISDGSFYGTANGIFNATEDGTLSLFPDAGSFSGRGRLLAASDGYVYGTEPQLFDATAYGTEGVGGGRVFRFTSSPPQLTNLSPSSALPGTTVTLTGKFLAGTSSVSFNGVEAASLQVVDASHISAVVPANAASGPVTVVNPLGSAVTAASFTALPRLPSSLNISTRVGVGTGDYVLIGGFIITGTQPKKVIVRAIGPSLSSQGLQDVLPDPVLELHEPDGNVIINDNWKDTQAAAIEDTQIPPTNDLESAIVQTLPPGSYTAVVHGKDAIGIGLVEVYDLDEATDSTLANISTRGDVNTGDGVMIGGFIVGGGESNSTIYVRAIGPSLPPAEIAYPLPDPFLELHDGNGTIVATNDNWKDSPDRADIIAAGLAPTNDLESVIKGNLAPGAYTGIVRGVGGTVGVGVVEVYNVR